MDEPMLIWVDENDCELGFGEKLQTHIEGRLHRAFSVFLYDRASGQLLLQRRAEGKYHSGGLWTNACCSHPRKGETLLEAVRARLPQELGLNAPLTALTDGAAARRPIGPQTLLRCGSFIYHHRWETLGEDELDHVFLYCPDEGIPFDALSPNPEEISALRCVTPDALERLLAEEPDGFTVWFRPAWALVRPVLERLSAN